MKKQADEHITDVSICKDLYDCLEMEAERIGRSMEYTVHMCLHDWASMSGAMHAFKMAQGIVNAALEHRKDTRDASHN